jgi:predicted small secreted protein
MLMRKLILALLLLAPFLAGCQRSRGVLDDLEPGSQVTVTRRDGQTVTGRLAENRPDALVLQPANGSPATVPRKDIATITVAVVPSNATPPAAPASAATGTSTAPPATPGQPAAGGSTAGREWREVVVPAGTQLAIRLEDPVASDANRPEDRVRASLLDSLVVRGVTAVPAGSTVSGTVTEAKRSGKVKGVAEIAIRFDSVKPKDGESAYKIRTGIVTRRAQTTHKQDALKIGGPALGGAILGGLFGGKKGALIGTTVGGGAGTAVVLSTRGKEVRLARGARLVIRLIDPLTVHVPA